MAGHYLSKFICQANFKCVSSARSKILRSYQNYEIESPKSPSTQRSLKVIAIRYDPDAYRAYFFYCYSVVTYPCCIVSVRYLVRSRVATIQHPTCISCPVDIYQSRLICENWRLGLRWCKKSLMFRGFVRLGVELYTCNCTIKCILLFLFD